MSKLRIKISGCMRSMTGAEIFCAIRSYLATATRHDIGWLDALTRAAEGHPSGFVVRGQGRVAGCGCGGADRVGAGQAAAPGGPQAAASRFSHSCSRCQLSGRCRVR